MTIAEEFFAHDRRLCEFEESLGDSGVSFEKIGWDYYDNSLEIYGALQEFRLSDEAVKIIQDAGFSRVFVNHVDHWETHYSEFNEWKGWRVSYPHTRGELDGKILVEERVDSWPKEWFETGYVVIQEREK